MERSSKLLSYPDEVAQWLAEERAPTSRRDAAPPSRESGPPPSSSPPSSTPMPLGYGQNRASRARIALGIAPKPWSGPGR